jgi:hypothetical protein
VTAKGLHTVALDRDDARELFESSRLAGNNGALVNVGAMAAEDGDFKQKEEGPQPQLSIACAARACCAGSAAPPRGSPHARDPAAALTERGRPGSRGARPKRKLPRVLNGAARLAREDIEIP